MLMGAVKVALQRPYTFVVMALVLLIIDPLATLRTPSGDQKSTGRTG